MRPISFGVRARSAAVRVAEAVAGADRDEEVLASRVLGSPAAVPAFATVPAVAVSDFTAGVFARASPLAHAKVEVASVPIPRTATVATETAVDRRRYIFRNGISVQENL